MLSDSAHGWYSDETATFGDRLAAAREKQGLEQADLARKLGVRATTTAQWEADASEPRANRVQMLSGLLGVSLRWLLTGEGDGPAGPDAATQHNKAATGLFLEMRQLQGQMLMLARQLGSLEARMRSAQVASE